MTTYRARKGLTRLLVTCGVVIALVVGGLIGAFASHKGPGANRPTSPKDGASSPTRPGSTTTSKIQVVSVDPAPGTDVAGDQPITITFSSLVDKKSALPTFNPSDVGTWKTSGHSLTFTPSTAFTPLSQVTMTIPGGTSGIRGVGGGHLAQSVVESFHFSEGSILRLQQILSVLDYSPLSWVPTGTPLAPGDTDAQTMSLYSPPAGTFSWKDKGWPARLQSFWHPGVDDVFTRGLVMSFQADHGLAPNGAIGPQTWTALLSALASNSLNTGGYNYALADKAQPQSLTIYHDGAVVLRSPANTGIADSPTPDGTFPVYTRLRRQVMRGSNPNGQKYADLVQYIAYFHGNDAVHYMNRADYGIPQSLGCVELPLEDAALAWPYLAYGTLVTVIG